MSQHEFLLSQNGKIIHQVWFTNIQSRKKTKEMYKSLLPFRQSWDQTNWVRVEWNQKTSRNFMREFFPEYVRMYDSYPEEIQRVDAIRYFLLFTYGGLYTDMDYFCNKNWESVITEYPKDIYFVQTPNGVTDDDHVSNSLIFSKPKHLFWRFLFIELDRAKDPSNIYPRHFRIMLSTGPTFLTRVYKRLKVLYSLGVYPSKTFHPYGLTSDSILKLRSNNNIYAIHLGKGSWEKLDSKILIFVYTEYKFLLFLFLFVLYRIFTSSTFLKRKV